MQADRAQSTFHQEAMVLGYVSAQNAEGFAVSSAEVARGLGFQEALAEALLMSLYEQGFLRREVDADGCYYQLSGEAWDRLSWFAEEGYL